MKRMTLLAVAAVFVLGGCASSHDEVPKHMRAYDAGFKDGCESGVWYDMSEIKVKDYQRAKNDRGYFHGWDEGFSECRYNAYREETLS